MLDEDDFGGYVSTPFGFIERDLYQHVSKHCDIQGVTFNSKTLELLLLDSRGVTAWSQHSVRRLLNYSNYQFNGLRKIVYCRHRNVYLGISREFQLKVYNVNFHETICTDYGQTFISCLVYIHSAQLFVSSERNIFKFWEFSENQNAGLYGIQPKRECQVPMDMQISRIEVDERTNRLYLLCERDVCWYDFQGILVFHIREAGFLHTSACCFSLGANVILVGDKSGRISLWSVAGGKVSDFMPHSNAVSGLLVHPCDDYMLLSSSMDGTVKLFSLHTQEELSSCNVFSEGVHCMLLTKPSTSLCCVSNRSLKILDLNYVYRFWSTVRCAVKSIGVYGFCSRPRHVLVISCDNSVRLYSHRSGKKRCTILPPPSVSPLREVGSVGYDRATHVVYILIQNEIWLYSTRTDPATRLCALVVSEILSSLADTNWSVVQDFHRDQSSFTSRPDFRVGDDDTACGKAHAEFGASLLKKKQQDDSVVMLCLTVVPFRCAKPEDDAQEIRALAGGLSNGIVLFADVAEGCKVIFSLRVHPTCPVSKLSVTRDGVRLASVVEDINTLRIRIWNTESWENVWDFKVQEKLQCFAFSAAHFACGNSDGSLDISCYGIGDAFQQGVRKSKEHSGGVISVDIHTSGHLVVTVGRDSFLRVWSVQKILLHEIKLDQSLSCASFLNSSGDIVMGFRSNLFVISHAIIEPCRSNRFPVGADDEEESDNDSLVYEDPHVRFELQLPREVKDISMENYLVPYPDLNLEGSWKRNLDLTSCSALESAAVDDAESPSDAESEVSFRAPTELYLGSECCADSRSGSLFEFPVCVPSPTRLSPSGSSSEVSHGSVMPSVASHPGSCTAVSSALREDPSASSAPSARASDQNSTEQTKSGALALRDMQLLNKKKMASAGRNIAQYGPRAEPNQVKVKRRKKKKVAVNSKIGRPADLQSPRGLRDADGANLANPDAGVVKTKTSGLQSQIGMDTSVGQGKDNGPDLLNPSAPSVGTSSKNQTRPSKASLPEEAHPYSLSLASGASAKREISVNRVAVFEPQTTLSGDSGSEIDTLSLKVVIQAPGTDEYSDGLIKSRHLQGFETQDGTPCAESKVMSALHAKPPVHSAGGAYADRKISKSVNKIMTELTSGCVANEKPSVRPLSVPECCDQRSDGKNYVELRFRPGSPSTNLDHSGYASGKEPGLSTKKDLDPSSEERSSRCLSFNSRTVGMSSISLNFKSSSCHGEQLSSQESAILLHLKDRASKMQVLVGSEDDVGLTLFPLPSSDKNPRTSESHSSHVTRLPGTVMKDSLGDKAFANGFAIHGSSACISKNHRSHDDSNSQCASSAEAAPSRKLSLTRFVLNTLTTSQTEKLSSADLTSRALLTKTPERSNQSKESRKEEDCRSAACTSFDDVDRISTSPTGCPVTPRQSPVLGDWKVDELDDCPESEPCGVARERLQPRGFSTPKVTGDDPRCGRAFHSLVGQCYSAPAGRRCLAGDWASSRRFNTNSSSESYHSEPQLLHDGDSSFFKRFGPDAMYEMSDLASKNYVLWELLRKRKLAKYKAEVRAESACRRRERMAKSPKNKDDQPEPTPRESRPATRSSMSSNKSMNRANSPISLKSKRNVTFQDRGANALLYEYTTPQSLGPDAFGAQEEASAEADAKGKIQNLEEKLSGQCHRLHPAKTESDEESQRVALELLKARATGLAPLLVRHSGASIPSKCRFAYSCRLFNPKRR